MNKFSIKNWCCIIVEHLGIFFKKKKKKSPPPLYLLGVVQQYFSSLVSVMYCRKDKLKKQNGWEATLKSRRNVSYKYKGKALHYEWDQIFKKYAMLSRLFPFLSTPAFEKKNHVSKRFFCRSCFLLSNSILTDWLCCSFAKKVNAKSDRVSLPSWTKWDFFSFLLQLKKSQQMYFPLKSPSSFRIGLDASQFLKKETIPKDFFAF